MNNLYRQLKFDLKRSYGCWVEWNQNRNLWCKNNLFSILTSIFFYIKGLYPKDLQIEELPSHELAVSWSPPELFDHYELNYIVNVYEIDQNKICVKRRELLSLTPSCLLRDLSSKTIYKISVWPVLAKTQKKKGWPNHTKYMIQDIGMFYYLYYFS